jgi:hypothetical protein
MIFNQIVIGGLVKDTHTFLHNLNYRSVLSQALVCDCVNLIQVLQV